MADRRGSGSTGRTIPPNYKNRDLGRAKRAKFSFRDAAGCCDLGWLLPVAELRQPGSSGDRDCRQLASARVLRPVQLLADAEARFQAAGRVRLPSGAWRRNRIIDDQRLLEQVRALRERRYTPAEIARSLAISKGEAARFVRMLAIESRTATADAGGARDETRCWINPGWRHGLRIEGHDDWPGDAGAPSKVGDSGVALVVVARSSGYDQLTTCSYLVDTWCLGVKNATGPKRMGRRELEALRRQCYGPWRSPGISIPLELAQHLVLGAVEFARRLGFEAHRDFKRARSVLGSWEGPSAITFGMDGRPHYINGPYEDPQRVLATL